MKQDMNKMKEQYGDAMVNLENNFERVEEKSRERYETALNTWKSRATNKISEYQEALKISVDQRKEIEEVFKDKLVQLKIENERIEKEKEYLTTENDEIKAKADVLEKVKATYAKEIEEKDTLIEK